MPNVSGEQIRNTLLEVIRDRSSGGAGSFQAGTVLRDAASRLGIDGNKPLEQALLTFWHNLFRQGYLAWGYDLSNISPPFCHLTEMGHKALEHVSRDPANPDGYMAYLSSKTQIGTIAKSYIGEGVQTFNSGCFKATAVMVGCASESMILELRDKIVGKITTGSPSLANLNDWRILTVLKAIQLVLDGKKSAMPRKLKESYEGQWSAIVHQIRTARNDAGHPIDPDRITEELVHAGLLLFPLLVLLIDELKAWVLSQASL